MLNCALYFPEIVPDRRCGCTYVSPMIFPCIYHGFWVFAELMTSFVEYVLPSHDSDMEKSRGAPATVTGNSTPIGRMTYGLIKKVWISFCMCLFIDFKISIPSVSSKNDF